MKRKKNLAKAVGVAVGAAAVSAMLAGCDLFSPDDNMLPAMYGPEEILDPDYTPEDNMLSGVYGPPSSSFQGGQIYVSPIPSAEEAGGN